MSTSRHRRRKHRHEATRNMAFEILQPRNLLAGLGPSAGTLVNVRGTLVHEAGGAAQFVVERLGPATGDVTVSWETAGGTALSGIDFQAACGIATLSEAETVIEIPVIDDALRESGETFSLRLSHPVGAELGNAEALATIVDDDAAGQLNGPLHYAPVGPVRLGDFSTTRRLASGLTLIYSTHGALAPVVAIDTVQPDGSAVPQQIEARLSVGGIDAAPVHYDAGALAPGSPQRFVLQADPATRDLASGIYPWEVTLTETHGTHRSFRHFAGEVALVNTSASPIGRNWTIAGVDQLVVAPGDALVIHADGTSERFASDLAGSFAARSPSDNALAREWDNTYTLTRPDGTATRFDADGRLTAHRDANGNDTTYHYQAGRLAAIIDPFGRTTALEYTDGWLSRVTDFAGRVTGVGHGPGGELTSVTDPSLDEPGPLDPPTTHYGYHPAPGLMSHVTDPQGSTDELFYTIAGHLESIRRADGSRVELDPAETRGLVHPGTGAGSAASPARIPAPGENQGRLRDELGNTWHFRFDAFGNVVQSVDPLDNVWRADTGAAGEVERVTDALGRVTQFAYEQGNLARITWPDGTTREWSYAANSRLPVAAVDELGRLTQMAYDDAGNLTSVTRVVGQVDDPLEPGDDLTTRYVYTSSGGTLPRGLPLAVVDPAGTTTEYQYGTDPELDSFGRLVRVTAAAGSSVESAVTFEYDTAGNVAAKIDPLGNRTEYAFDARDRLRTVALPATGTQAPGVRRFEYDAAGQRVTVVDAAGNPLDYTYDERGRLVSIELPDPDAESPAERPRVSYDYDARGHLVRFVGADGAAASYDYDPLGGLSRVVLPLGESGGDSLETRYQRDAAGRITTITDPRGQTTTYAYDARDRVLAIERADPDGAGPQVPSRYEFQYDAAGQLVRAVDPVGRVFAWSYDDAGRLTARHVPSADPARAFETREYAYDRVGNLVAIVDPSGVAATYRYDELGRLTATEMADPDAGGPAGLSITAFQYDAAGNRTALTDALGNVTRWQYDARRRMIAELDPYGHARRFEYDQQSNPVRYTDRNGRTTEWRYDALGRAIAETWLDGGVIAGGIEYAYAASGRLARVAGGDWSYDFGHDALGRLREVGWNHGGRAIELEQSFDGAGNRIELAVTVPGPDGPRRELANEYAFDAVNRMTAVRQAGAPQELRPDKHVEFHYDASGRPERVRRTAGAGPVMETEYGYDRAGRLNRLMHHGAGTARSQLDLRHDPAGRLLEVAASDAGGHVALSQYAYDGQGRLVAESRDGVAVAAALDALGNPAGASVEPGNRLAADGRYAYQYDSEGNRIRRTRLGGGPASDWTTQYEWDHRNRLTGVRQRDVSGEPTVEIQYAYDVFGNRIRESMTDAVAGRTHTLTHVYDGDRLLASFDESGAVAHRYLHGPAVDQILADERLDPGSGAASLAWTLADHLGSVTELVDADGLVTATRRYDANGRVVAGGAEARFGFTGQQLDAPTGLQYHRARYYDPQAARWLSEDPLGFGAGDPNLYRYAGNSPTNFVDPSGLEAISSIPWYRDAMIDIFIDVGAPAAGAPSEAWWIGFLQGLMPNFGRPGNPYPVGMTWGAGLAADVHLGPLHLGAALDVHVGMNPYAANPDDIFTFGVTSSLQYAVCSSIGLGCTAGMEVIMTDAPYVGALQGTMGSAGAQVGPVTVEYVTSGFNNNARPLPGGAAPPGYQGVIIAVGGVGGGVHVDEMNTFDLFHTGPTNPPVTFGPPQNNAGDGAQYLNPND